MKTFILRMGDGTQKDVEADFYEIEGVTSNAMYVSFFNRKGKFTTIGNVWSISTRNTWVENPDDVEQFYITVANTDKWKSYAEIRLEAGDPAIRTLARGVLTLCEAYEHARKFEDQKELR